MSQAPCIMVLGTTSDAGKSWLVTAICRYLSNRGYKVAPFKAQNMSNNARVVPAPGGGWGEIGSAQYFQALAARAAPTLAMNPVLLKPESDCSSQVVVMGKVDRELSALPWKERSSHLWPHIQAAVDDLRERYDFVVIEGAGSPAEINLRSRDIVNMSVAHYTQADCLLVCDIDRGGAFAHLYGTWALLDERDQSRIRAFVLNKFRGDPALLAPGPDMLYERTQVPIVGVIPMVRSHALPEEDGQSAAALGRGASDRPRIVIISYPRISNLDEFANLAQLQGHELVWTQDPQELEDAELLILPGSKHTQADLVWLRERGLDRAIQQFAGSGKPVLGICGGMQMLGERISGQEAPLGPQRIAHQEPLPGLGLLGIETNFSGDKTLTPTRARLGEIKEGPWSALSEQQLSGYEIHVGDTRACEALPAQPLIDEVAWLNAQGNVLGLYIHGIFEDPAVVTALFNESVTPLEETFETLAQTIGSTQIPDILLDLLEQSS